MDDTNDVAQSGLDALSDSVLGPANDEPNETPDETPEPQPQPEAQPEVQAEQPLTTKPEELEPASPAEATVAAPAEEETEEEYQEFQPTYGQVPPLDLSQLPQDEEGNVDANSLAQAIAQRDQALLQQAASMVQQAEERREEEKLWNKALEAHPELRTDKALAEEVNALRFGLFAKDINSGKQARMMTPTQAYGRMQKRFSQAEAKGITQATESVKIQESVYTQPVANASSGTSDEADLFNKMRSPDRKVADAAADAILSKRLFGE
jgi:hypothetical protein